MNQALSSPSPAHSQAQVSSVTVTTDRAALGLPELFPSLEIGQVTQRLSDAGIEVRVNTLVDSVTDGRVMTTSGYDLGAYDSIVLCTGAESTPVPAKTRPHISPI